MPTTVIAEIGINHNGDVEIAKRLIDAAVDAGCDMVKFQKRHPEICVPADQVHGVRETPWGAASYLAYKERLEFGRHEYTIIDRHCRERGIPWFASCWDIPSVEFMEQFNPPCYKVASACLTDIPLLSYTTARGRPMLLSTGMSTMDEIDDAITIVGIMNATLLHCVSTYPAEPEELNLAAMATLRKEFGVPVGYSGHERGISISVAAVAMGACVIERHITLDRTMWGTDQAASLEPHGIKKLVRDIRLLEKAIGDGVKRVMPREIPIREKLRSVPNTLEK